MPRLSDLPALLGDLEAQGLLRTPSWRAPLPFGLIDFCRNDYLGWLSGPGGDASVGDVAEGSASAVSRETPRGGDEPSLDPVSRETPEAQRNPLEGGLSLAAARPGSGSGGTRATPPGAGAARLVYGTHPAHAEAEGLLAEWLGYERALLFSSGYAANVGALGCLMGPNDLVLSDALNHASLIDGIRLSRAKVQVFPHLDLAAARRLGQAQLSGEPTSDPRARDSDGSARKEREGVSKPGAVWLVLESYYSMDGNGPDLRAARALCDELGWHLYVDEAHALGVYGPGGAGLCAASGVRADVLMAGLGKGIGSAGGAVLCSEAAATWLWNRARAFVFSTAPSPRAVEALIGQIEATRTAEERRARLQANVAFFRAQAAAAGLPLVEAGYGPVVGILLGTPEAALRVAAEVRERGFLVQAIRPPTVPRDASRIRITIRATHEESHLQGLVGALAASLQLTNPVSTNPVSTNPVQTNPVSANPVQAKRIILLGTGTNIGKTYVGSRLVSSLTNSGRRTLGLKPIESGLPTSAAPGDWSQLGQGGLVQLPPKFALADPVSPHLAARREGVAIGMPEILSWVQEAEAKWLPEWSVIETAGGAFSPITQNLVNADLAQALGGLQLLIAPNRLGVLHDVAATLGALGQPAADSGGRSSRAPRRVPVSGILLSEHGEPDASQATNLEELARAVLPRFLGPSGKPLALFALERGATNCDAIVRWLEGAET